MLFTITPDNKLIDVKHQFEEDFPGLKIEFFAHPHHAGEGSHVKEKLIGSLSIAEVAPEFVKNTFILESHLTVAELEKKFLNEAGLNIQVFRKMGHVWLETIQTDGYTLQRQMELSAESRS